MGQGPQRMLQNVIFRAGQACFDGEFNDNAIVTAINQQLPISSVVKRWGEEIYFDAPVKIANTAPTLEVKVGDIAYWPEGPCLCIFFGKTPASQRDEPRPASEVTIVGHTDASTALLRSIREGTRIVLEHANPTQNS